MVYHKTFRSGELNIHIPTQTDCEAVLTGKVRGINFVTRSFISMKKKYIITVNILYRYAFNQGYILTQSSTIASERRRENRSGNYGSKKN